MTRLVALREPMLPDSLELSNNRVAFVSPSFQRIAGVHRGDMAIVDLAEMMDDDGLPKRFPETPLTPSRTGGRKGL